MTSFTFFPPFFPIFLPLERKPDPDEYKEIADAIRWAAMTPAERKAEREAERKALEADRKQASKDYKEAALLFLIIVPTVIGIAAILHYCGVIH
jgi:hypothetical protein